MQSLPTSRSSERLHPRVNRRRSLSASLRSSGLVILRYSEGSGSPARAARSFGVPQDDEAQSSINILSKSLHSNISSPALTGEEMKLLLRIFVRLHGPAEHAVAVGGVDRSDDADRSHRDVAERAFEIAGLGAVEDHAGDLRADAHQMTERLLHDLPLLAAGDRQHNAVGDRRDEARLDAAEDRAG